MTVLPSSETSQLSAMPGLGSSVSGSKLSSSSQLSAQIVYSSSFTPTNGFSVFASWAQPIRRTSLPESCAVAAGPPSAIAPATSTASNDPPASNLDLIRASSSLNRRLQHLEGLAGRRRRAPARPSGIVAMCLPWPTGTFAIAGIPSGATSSSSISSIESVDSEPSGGTRECRLTSVPKTRPAASSSLPARIRWLIAVSTRYSSSFRSSTISTQPSVSTSNGVPMLALSSVMQPPTSGPSPMPSPTVST